MPRPTPGEAWKTPAIAGSTRNPVRQSNFKMRRFAPEVYDSGFRVKPGMTKGFFDGGLFFASPGALPCNRHKGKGE
jgi:hypothetical protein